MKKLTLAFALVAGVSMLSCAPGTPKLGKASLDKVIAAMTPEEKVHLLIGTGMEGFSAGDSAVVGETKNLVPGAAGTTYPIPRLGIPCRRSCRPQNLSDPRGRQCHLLLYAFSYRDSACLHMGH